MRGIFWGTIVCIFAGPIVPALADPPLTCAGFTNTMQTGSHDDQVPYLIGIGKDAGIDTLTVEPDGTDLGERFAKTAAALLAGVAIECSGRPDEEFDDVLKTVFSAVVIGQLNN